MANPVLTAKKLATIAGCDIALANKYLPSILETIKKYNIESLLRLSAFLAQITHESDGLKNTTASTNYSADALLRIFPSRFDAVSAAVYARKPVQIANRAYSNKNGNGNEASGDGYKYRDRGLIQLNGKANYQAASKSLGVDLLSNPDLVAGVKYAALTAGWFWSSKNLNAYADRKDFDTITRRVNGTAMLGAADRTRRYKLALRVLTDAPEEDETKTPDPEPDATTEIYQKTTKPAKKQQISEPQNSASPVYPWNTVYESKSGHVIEIDDTQEAERIAIQHKTGSYTETDSEGSVTVKSVANSHQYVEKDLDAYVGGDFTQKIDGEVFVSVDGDMVTKTKGEQTLDSDQSITLNTPVVIVTQTLEGNIATLTMLTCPMMIGIATMAMSLIPGASASPNFSMENLEQSMDFTNGPSNYGNPSQPRTGDPIFKKPLTCEQPVTVGAAPFMIFDDPLITTGNNKIPCYQDNDGLWRKFKDDTIFTP